MCQQSVGLLQRVLDEAGIPTVSITLVAEITRLVRPSLACLVEHPFGLTLGDVGDQATHRLIVERALEAATQEHPAGTILDFQMTWSKDDLRTRQLRKAD